MSYIKKPRIQHPDLAINGVGLSIHDYEGAMSTLCAGCGHDSVSAAIMQAFFELDILPYKVVKLSGIGCSSKTPTYFLRGAHGFNSVHGRMPSIATGANAANQDLHYIGISGDGDSLSIGLGQLCHAIRRNPNMLYVLENNGVYGLTKGQFSASADIGSTAKVGTANQLQPIDPVLTAIDMGGSFVARGFSGDKGNLVPLIKAGIMHRGFALLDVISPCVTFNDHEGSTKSYLHTREIARTAVFKDFVPEEKEIIAVVEQEVTRVNLHGGNQVSLLKVNDHYDPANRSAAATYVRQRQEKGEIATGLLYINDDLSDFHETSGTVDRPLASLDYETLNPGSKKLKEIQKAWS